MSRVQRRSGTKALRCMECQHRLGSGAKGGGLLFRGKSRERLNKHLREVHGRKI